MVYSCSLLKTECFLHSFKTSLHSSNVIGNFFGQLRHCGLITFAKSFIVLFFIGQSAKQFEGLDFLLQCLTSAT